MTAPSEVLELIEAALDAVPQFIDDRIVWDRRLSRSGGRDDGGSADPIQMLAKAVGVVGSVGEDGLWALALQQSRDGENVMALPWSDKEPHRPSQAVAGHVNLGGQSTSGAPHSRIEAPFF